jgi:DNA-binding MarR family transcriptional regulator
MVQTNRTTGAPPARRSPTSFPSLVDALYTVVRRAHRLRSVRVHSSCDKAGLVLLGQLVEQGPMRLSDLASAVQLDPSTVSRQVRALCDGGFTVAVADPDDKRARRLQISAKGRAEVEAVARELAEVLGRAVRDWPQRDVTTLTELLARLGDELASSDEARVTQQPEETAQ